MLPGGRHSSSPSATLRMTTKRPQLAAFIENAAESTTACLVAMVQGNLLVLSMSHWLIASRTGLLAGVIASVAILLARTNRRWLVSLLLGLATGVVDYFVHPGGFGAVWMEAVVTGVGAALLSFIVGTVLQRRRMARGL